MTASRAPRGVRAPAARAIASAASSVPAARSDSSAEASSTPRWWARSRAASRVSSRRYSTRSASTASPSPQRSRSGASLAGSAPTARSSAAAHGVRRRGGWSRGTGRPARATARGAGTGGRSAPGSRRAPRAAASPCPRRRRARATSPGSARSARRTSPARAWSGSAVRASSATSGSASSPSRASSSARGAESVEPEPQQPGAHGVAAGAHRVNLRPRLRARVLRRVLDLVQAIRKLSCLMWGGMRRAAVVPLGATLAALLAAGLVTALPAGPALPQTAPAPGPAQGRIRVNQQGYLPGEPKQARLMTTAPVHDARYRVTDHAGARRPARSRAPALDRVVERPVPRRSTGSTSAGCTTPGRYRVATSGDVDDPLPLVPRAGRRRHLRDAPPRRRRLRPEPARRRARRCRPAPPPAVPPARPAGVDLPVAPDGARLRPDPRPPPAPHRRAGRRLGRLVRRGRLPEVHPLHGVQRRAAVHQRPPARPPRTQPAGRRGPVRAALADEDVGRQAPARCYIQVGIGSGNRAGTFRGDHDLWRLPQADDRDTRHADRFVSHRPVFRGRAAGPPDQPQPGRSGRRPRSRWPPSRTPAATRRGPAASCARRGCSTRGRRRRTRRTRW